MGGEKRPDLNGAEPAIDFDAETLAAEVERVRWDHYERHMSSTRTAVSATAITVVSAIFVVATAHPDAPTFMSLPLSVTVPVFGALLLVMLGATFAAHRWGVRSAQHRAIERLESIVAAGLGAALIYASGSSFTIWWFVPVALALQNLPFQGVYHYWTLVPIALEYGGISAAFYVTQGPGEGVTSLSMTGMVMIIAWHSMEFSRRAVRAEARERVVHAKLRELLVERERERIARDLHDTVGADLTSMVWEARQLRRTVDAEELDRFTERIRGTLQQLRQTVLELERGECSAQELGAEIEARITQLFSSRIDAVIDIDADAMLAGHCAQALIRSVDECVLNAAVHGAATRVWIDITAEDEQLRVSVRDDGVGVEPERLEAGLGGTRHLRQRLDALGGDVQFESGVDGTLAQLTVPIE